MEEIQPSVGRHSYSKMPCHLISDVHEWINKIPTIPIYYLAKPHQSLCKYIHIYMLIPVCPKGNTL